MHYCWQDPCSLGVQFQYVLPLTLLGWSCINMQYYWQDPAWGYINMHNHWQDPGCGSINTVGSEIFAWYLFCQFSIAELFVKFWIRGQAFVWSSFPWVKLGMQSCSFPKVKVLVHRMVIVSLNTYWKSLVHIWINDLVLLAQSFACPSYQFNTFVWYHKKSIV